MSEQESCKKSLVSLFRPTVEVIVRNELEQRLQRPLYPEQVDQWINMVKSARRLGRLKKAAIITRLMLLRRAASKGKQASLSNKERDRLMRETMGRLPEKIVRDWLNALSAYAADHGNLLRVADFSQAMMPADAPALLLDQRFEVFGIDRSRIMTVLEEVGQLLPSGERLPADAVRYLNLEGITVEK